MIDGPNLAEGLMKMSKLTRRQAALEREFAEVRSLYFPRWRNGKKWKVAEGFISDLWPNGECHIESCTIYISPQYVELGGHELRALLIHEICHVVASGGHGKVWGRRLGKTVEVAERIGDAGVATILSKEVKDCLAGHFVGAGGAPEIYEYLSDAVVEVEHEPQFDHMLAYVAQSYLLTVDDFLKKYPRAKRVFDKAMRERASIRKRVGGR